MFLIFIICHNIVFRFTSRQQLVTWCGWLGKSVSRVSFFLIASAIWPICVRYYYNYCTAGVPFIIWKFANRRRPLRSIFLLHWGYLLAFKIVLPFFFLGGLPKIEWWAFWAKMTLSIAYKSRLGWLRMGRRHAKEPVHWVQGCSPHLSHSLFGYMRLLKVSVPVLSIGIDTSRKKQFGFSIAWRQQV